VCVGTGIGELSSIVDTGAALANGQYRKISPFFVTKVQCAVSLFQRFTMAFSRAHPGVQHAAQAHWTPAGVLPRAD
jgi:hypothetical protein